MKRIFFCLTFMLLCIPLCHAQTTVRQQMEQLQEQHGVSFVYDSSLPLDAPYTGESLNTLPLAQALEHLFNQTAIIYRIQGDHVLLKLQKTKRESGISYTVSGYVRDAMSETLINATVCDLTTRQSTMTNEYGYFSLTLPEGSHELRFTYLGFEAKTLAISLTKNQSLDVRMSEDRSNALAEVVVTADLNSPVYGTQMGKRSLSQADIKTEYSLFSTPDVVKTLQRLSGVQEGVELVSGLYVHGGNGDENLFLIDGTPLYSVNHSLGLFSSFNVDVVKNVDFYKSGFPARYGGRLSSVVDVRTNDGNFDRLHGSYRIGLLDGSVQMDGPIRMKGDRERERQGMVRGTDFGTSFNIGLRRSWLDLITRPAFAIANSRSDENKLNVSYAFHDLNAKVTHIFNNRSRLSLSIYSGGDNLDTRDDWRENYDNGKTHYSDCIDNEFSWGNTNAALNWNYQLSPKLMANVTAVYTHNRTRLNTDNDNRIFDLDGKENSIIFSQHNYHSTIDDIGYRTEFDYRPVPRHHIRFGHDYTYHFFRPQTNRHLNFWGDYLNADTLDSNSQNRHNAYELTVYGEDQMTLSDRWSLNCGANVSLFHISGKSFASFDPRLAVKYQLLASLSLKVSYTRMTQYVHKISNAFLELPTDYWVPTTSRLKPMHSHQMAAGVYWQPQRQWTLSLEGYYKETRHLLQYSSWAGIEPPAASWDTQVMDGRGRFYGLEADAQYRGGKIQADAAYTLSWNKRRFDKFYQGWFYDKFDNRHKLNISMRYSFSKKTQMYAAWTYHTGNHLTFPTQYVRLPDVPDMKPVTSDYFYGYYNTNEPETRYIYEKPNNITLPAYHRLDLGFNFRHTTKHGHERIWNISVYNAYCHLNTLWTEIEMRQLENNKVDLAGHKTFQVKTHGYIPIIPSFSYTIKF